MPVLQEEPAAVTRFSGEFLLHARHESSSLLKHEKGNIAYSGFSMSLYYNLNSTSYRGVTRYLRHLLPLEATAGCSLLETVPVSPSHFRGMMAEFWS